MDLTIPTLLDPGAPRIVGRDEAMHVPSYNTYNHKLPNAYCILGVPLPSAFRWADTNRQYPD
ncbi:MAG: hypothetical protein AAFP81_08420 [Pseudomonadota bacterium]